MAIFSADSAVATRACLLGGLALFAVGPAEAADDLNTWSYFRDVYYDTSPKGADIAAFVGNFPVLVR